MKVADRTNDGEQNTSFGSLNEFLCVDSGVRYAGWLSLSLSLATSFS